MLMMLRGLKQELIHSSTSFVVAAMGGGTGFSEAVASAGAEELPGGSRPGGKSGWPAITVGGAMGVP